MLEGAYRFYSFGPRETPPPPPSLPGYRVEAWRPHGFALAPPGLPTSAKVFGLMHRLHLFAMMQFGFLLIRRDDVLVHHSMVTARYFRFPDMGPRDLQIGATMTIPSARGQGLATAAIAGILHAWHGMYERMWYIVEEANTPSIKAVEKAGFVLRGRGIRTRPLGVGALGSYRLLEQDA